jgi:hypothetical protein
MKRFKDYLEVARKWPTSSKFNVAIRLMLDDIATKIEELEKGEVKNH